MTLETETQTGSPCDRNIDQARDEAQRMIDLISTPEAAISQDDRTWVAETTYQNFANHINKGFLEYRKSVTETDDFALTDWYGEGSILRDVLGREYIDMLGGFGLYSPGIRHPKIVAAAKAQLDRSPQYSQEMLDPLRAHLARVIAHLTPGDIQYGFFANSGTEAVEGAMKLAKLYTGRKGFISTLSGFHGKTLRLAFPDRQIRLSPTSAAAAGRNPPSTLRRCRCGGNGVEMRANRW